MTFDFIPQKATVDASVIVVGEAGLLPLIMARNPRLGEDAAREYLKSIAPAQHAKLTEEYVREEVMYRQAIALGLDNNNYNERRRLIRQFEYLNEGFIYKSLKVDEEALAAHLEANQDRYSVPAQVTFTHVYFSGDRTSSNGSSPVSFSSDGASAGASAGDSGAAPQSMAIAELAYLNNVNLPFHHASSRGDHFLYHRNYINKNKDHVASHFGPSFAASVFAVDQAQANWLGPFQSELGYHLVRLSSKREAHVPPLSNIRAKVLDDLTRIRVKQQLGLLYEEVRRHYEIRFTEPEKTS